MESYKRDRKISEVLGDMGITFESYSNPLTCAVESILVETIGEEDYISCLMDFADDGKVCFCDDGHEMKHITDLNEILDRYMK